MTDAAAGLSTEPRPTNPKHGHKMQSKYLEIWTRYVGLNYRILYSVDDAARTVTVTEVGPREGIYKRGR